MLVIITFLFIYVLINYCNAGLICDLNFIRDTVSKLIK